MLSERSPAAKESSLQGFRYGKFSEGSHSSKKLNLQKLTVWVNIFCFTLNSTLDHDVQVPT